MEILINRFKYILASIIGFLIVILFSILNIFFNFRFGIIYTSRIGHLCHNLDSYLSSRKRNEIAIFGTQKKISNYLIFNCWKKSKNIFFSKAGFFGYFFLSEFFPNHKMLIQWKELYPNYSSLMLKKKNIKIKYTEKFKSISDFNEKKHFICFHNRDSAYLESLGGDNNDHDYRDYKFNDYKKTISFLSKKKIQSIRIGRLTNSKANIKSQLYYDYSNKNSNDNNDVFLIDKCEFLVASATGLANIASILRKKTLFVNFIPFWLREMYGYTANSLFIPKKLYSYEKKRFLKFFEIENLKYDIHEKNFFKKRSLRVVNNTPHEIYMATKEMLTNYNKKDLKIYNTELHDRFWASLKDQRASKILRHKLKINISNNFLLKNKNLI